MTIDFSLRHTSGDLEPRSKIIGIKIFFFRDIVKEVFFFFFFLSKNQCSLVHNIFVKFFFFAFFIPIL